MNDYERDVRVASSKLKTPCRTIAEYKQKYNMSFVDTPENLDKLCVSLWGYKYETLKTRTNYEMYTSKRKTGL